MILDEKLQIKMNLDVLENLSIVRRNASWAISVKESASSKIITFIWNLLEIVFFRQKSFILFLMISIPLLSEVFNFRTKFECSFPNTSFVKILTI